MNATKCAPRAAASELCLACGLCCNGVIFADVKLQPGDEVGRLRALALRFAPGHSGEPAQGESGPGQTLNASASSRKFTQPCVFLEGCRCRIYPERPVYCRDFECGVLKKMNRGQLSISDGRRVIQKARRRAEKVRRLLRTVGDSDEQLALAARFRQTAKRLEQAGSDEKDAAVYGKLTVAVHDLNVLLSEAFYPG